MKLAFWVKHARRGTERHRNTNPTDQESDTEMAKPVKAGYAASASASRNCMAMRFQVCDFTYTYSNIWLIPRKGTANGDFVTRGARDWISISLGHRIGVEGGCQS
jgi:hypothetical protein